MGISRRVFFFFWLEEKADRFFWVSLRRKTEGRLGDVLSEGF